MTNDELKEIMKGWPKLKRDHAGCIVKTLIPIKTRMHEIPVGTVFTITRAYMGLNMTSKPCECCGVSVRVSRVSYTDVELIKAKKPNA